MIIEWLLYALSNGLMSAPFWVQLNIPSIPEDIMQRMYDYLDLFEYARCFIGFFIPGAAFEFGLTAFLILFAFEKLWPVIMWILNKIPFINID